MLINCLLTNQNKLVLLFAIILYSCNENSDIPQYESYIKSNCSYERLDHNGYLKDKSYDDRFETLNYRDIKVRRLEYKSTNFSSPSNAAYEVIKNNKTLYLADTLDISYSKLRGTSFYKIESCFLSDLNSYVLDGMERKSQMEFLTLFYTMLGRQEVYRKSYPTKERLILIKGDKIESPMVMDYDKGKILIIPIDFGIYKLFHSDPISNEISGFVVKPVGMDKVYRY